MESTGSEERDPLRQSPFVGREQTLTAIEQASQKACDTASCVVYLEGEGGIGKTRILSEVHHRLAQPPRVISTDVIDLYHVRYHQRFFLMYTIADRLQRALQQAGIQKPFFTAFQKAYQEFFARREAIGTADPTKLADLRATFLEDYTEATRERCVMVLLDTFEKLHIAVPYASTDTTRRSSHLEDWLRDLIADLPRTLIVIAGRPRPVQSRMLANKFTGRCFEKISIEPFTEDEVKQYIAEQQPGLSADDQEDLLQTLYKITQGTPILLSIGLELTRITDPSALPVTPAELKGQPFVARIITRLREKNVHFSRLLEIMLLLRKGVTAALLRVVLQEDSSVVEDVAQIEDAFEQLKGLQITKVTVDPEVPPEERLVTLHDEVYELLHETLGQGFESKHTFQSAINYLNEQIATRQRQVSSGDSILPQDMYIQTRQVERLFYTMALDPVQGYQEYRELCFSAIQANDEDFDNQLRDEFARFYEVDEHGNPATKWSQHYRDQLQDRGFNWKRFELDEGIRSVYREMTKGKDYQRYERAIARAETVRQEFQGMFATNTLEAMLDQYSLDVAKLQAQIFMHDPNDPQGLSVSKQYNAVVKGLDAVRTVLEDSAQGAVMRMRMADFHQSQLVLAIAYSDWGYFERTKQRLEPAIENYKQAIKLFKNLGPEVRELHAMTLNNLGFAQSLQGDSEHGLRAVEEALRMRQELGVQYSIALSLNTLARVHARLDRPESALEHVRTADVLFGDDETTVRGRALCALAEGLVRRKLATRQGALSAKEEMLDLAEAAYRRAADVFDNLRENERQVEAYLGLGKTHRAWADALIAAGQTTTVHEHIEQARQYLEQAAALSADGQTKTPERVDIMLNQASILSEQGEYDKALEKLDEARQGVPRLHWRFDRSTSTPITKSLQDIKLYLLRMGQIEFQRGLCLFEQAKHQEAVECFARTFAYLIEFFPEPRVQLRTYRTMILDKLRGLEEKPLLEFFKDHAQKHIQEASTQLKFAAETKAAITKLFDDVLEELDLF
jgi:tetratricopeptide (TPR) repeat protein